MSDRVHSFIETGKMPPDAEGRRRHHQIAELSDRVTKLVERESLAQGREYVRRLVRALLADEFWTAIVAALDTAADANEGRYRAERAVDAAVFAREAPEDQWDALVCAQLEALGLLDPAAPDWDARARRANVELLKPLLLFWRMVERSWQHGLFGAYGKQMSSEVGNYTKLPQELQSYVEAL